MVLDSIFNGAECTLKDILSSRENRVSAYTALLLKNKCQNVITLCVNMPGNIKENRASELFFTSAKGLLEDLIPNPVFKEETHSKTGPELYMGTCFDSKELKKSILDMESKYNWLRMLDIDVIDADKGHIGRSDVGGKPLSCFVCNCNAKECSSRQKHSSMEIKKAITGYFIETLAFRVGELASKSLIQEALCTPKPGLVDLNNNGSHRDMNPELLIKSAETLQPFFEKMCLLGFNDSTFNDLRELGYKAERAMFSATGNVNTHKGAIFCLGLLSYSYAKCIASSEKPNPEDICSNVKRLVKGIESEVSKEALATRGLGARGQALDGYSLITDLALPFFAGEVRKSSENRAMSLTLLLLISKNRDANILSRSNPETLQWACKQCEKLFKKNANEKEIKELDTMFIEKNISPGGSADLLAATYFLYNLPFTV